MFMHTYPKTFNGSTVVYVMLCSTLKCIQVLVQPPHVLRDGWHRASYLVSHFLIFPIVVFRKRTTHGLTFLTIMLDYPMMGILLIPQPSAEKSSLQILVVPFTFFLSPLTAMVFHQLPNFCSHFGRTSATEYH